MQGDSARGRDTITIMSTLGYRVSAPLPLWKLRRNRAYDAACARVDALISSCIARERAKIAAAATTSTTAAAAATTDATTVATASTTAAAAAADDGSGGTDADDVCLLNKLLQCKLAEGDVTADVTNRNALSEEEVKQPLRTVAHQHYS
jgi:hypothetical protein